MALNMIRVDSMAFIMFISLAVVAGTELLLIAAIPIPLVTIENFSSDLETEWNLQRLHSRSPDLRNGNIGAWMREFSSAKSYHGYRRILIPFIDKPDNGGNLAVQLISILPSNQALTSSDQGSITPGPNGAAVVDSPNESSEGSKSLAPDFSLALAIGIPGLVGALILLIFGAWLVRKKRKGYDAPQNSFRGKTAPMDFSNPDGKGFSVGSWIMSFRSVSFVSKKPRVWLSSACEMEFSALQTATNNFSTANILGEGGSGLVYKAKLDGGTLGAVKLLQCGSEQAWEEFQARRAASARLRIHEKWIRGGPALRYGFNVASKYIPQRILDPRPSKGSGLTWNLRIKIALESARGLEYLHEDCIPPVVHRDFKSSNILLDANFNAKISDFGLATRLQGLTRKESLKLVGTIGYVAPEFFESGTLTEKSDVYAFGVTLLELLTGRKPIDHAVLPEELSLVNWATPQLTDRNKLPLLVDAQLRDDLNLKHLYQVAAVAALCVQSEPSYRPLIADVVQSLVPLVPIEYGGALRAESSSQRLKSRSSSFHNRGSSGSLELKSINSDA